MKKNCLGRIEINIKELGTSKDNECILDKLTDFFRHEARLTYDQNRAFCSDFNQYIRDLLEDILDSIFEIEDLERGDVITIRAIDLDYIEVEFVEE